VRALPGRQQKFDIFGSTRYTLFFIGFEKTVHVHVYVYVDVDVHVLVDVDGFWRIWVAIKPL